MGRFFSKLKEKFDDIRYKIEDVVDSAIYKVKSFFGKVKFDSKSVDSHIDVDRVFADYRNKINPDARKLEDECIQKVDLIFMELKSKVEYKFPDLADIIIMEKEKTDKDLSGTIMNYVKEHFSKNDSYIKTILEMPPGLERNSAMEKQIRRVLNNANTYFNNKLKKHTNNILKEVNNRLEMRISEQEKMMNKQINDLEKLEREIKKGSIDINKIINDSIPQIESAQCTISMLETLL